jgi:hypothetical protein
MYVPNEHPYMMKREGFRPVGADAPSSPLHINPSTEMGHREPMTTITVAAIKLLVVVFVRHEVIST